MRLGPMLEAWDKLASSMGSHAGMDLKRSGSRGRRLSAGPGRAEETGLQPVEEFVAMENESATELCRVVTTSLGALKKVRELT